MSDIKIGSKVRNRYTRYEGIVLQIWGERFNPYRVKVRFGQDYIDRFGGGLLGDGTVLQRMEALLLIEDT